MKTLHTDKDGRLFFRKDGFPEKPTLTKDPASPYYHQTMQGYDQALSKAFEDAVPVDKSALKTLWGMDWNGNNPLSFDEWVQPLTAYDLPEGYRLEISSDELGPCTIEEPASHLGMVWIIWKGGRTNYRLSDLKAYLVPVPSVAPKCTGKKYCDCAKEAMAGGANRNWVDGLENDCPYAEKKETVTEVEKKQDGEEIFNNLITIFEFAKSQAKTIVELVQLDAVLAILDVEKKRYADQKEPSGGETQEELWAKVINDCRWYDGSPQNMVEIREHFRRQGIVITRKKGKEN